MASPTVSGAQVTVDASALTDRTLTAPTGISNGDQALVLGGWNSSAPTFTFGWTGTVGSGNWAAGPTADKTTSTDFVASWTGTYDSSNTNFWKVHTSASRALVLVTAKIAGADTTVADWPSEAHTTGSGLAVTVGFSTLDTTKDRLLVALIVGGTGATDPVSLPDSWVKLGSGVAATGTGASYFYAATRAAAAGATPADQTFTFTGTGGAWESMVMSIPAAVVVSSAHLLSSLGVGG